MPEQSPPQKPGKFGRDLTTGSIPRHLLMFSLPMLGGSVLQTAYSIVNAIWVGRYLGSREMAAVTVSMPLFFLFMAVAMGLTMASNILIAQYVGARNWTEVRRVVQNSSLLVALVSLVLLILGELCVAPFLQLIHTPPDTLPVATGYLRIFLLAMPCNFAMFLVAAMLRGIGDSKTPLYFQTIFLVLTAILDPVLMFGKLGIPGAIHAVITKIGPFTLAHPLLINLPHPHLDLGFAGFGLNGTAWAMLITMGGAVVSILLYLTAKRNPVTPSLRVLVIDRDITWLTVKIGFPSMLQQAMASIGMLCIIGFVNFYGEAATAAYGAALRIDQISFMPAMAIGMAVSTLTGQNMGAGRLDRVGQTFRWGILLSCTITAAVAVVVVCFPGLLILPFTNDAQVLAIGTQYLRIMWISYVLFAVMFVSNGVINGAGHTMVTTLISAGGLWFVRLLLVWLLSQVVLHSVTGVWIAMVISVGTGMIGSLIYYYSKRWQQQVVHAAPLTPPDDAPTLTPVLDTSGESG